MIYHLRHQWHGHTRSPWEESDVGISAVGIGPIKVEGMMVLILIQSVFQSETRQVRDPLFRFILLLDKLSGTLCSDLVDESYLWELDF